MCRGDQLPKTPVRLTKFPMPRASKYPVTEYLNTWDVCNCTTGLGTYLDTTHLDPYGFEL